MTLAEFERQVFAVATASPICGIPVVRRLTPTSINLRLDVTTGGFIRRWELSGEGVSALLPRCEGAARGFGKSKKSLAPGC